MASATLRFSSSSLSTTAVLPHQQYPLTLPLPKPNYSFLSPPILPSLSLRRLSLSSLASQRPTLSDIFGDDPWTPKPKTPDSETSPVVETKSPPPKREEIFAVVMIGSRQYIVIPGRWIYTQRLKGANANDKIILNKVLLVGTRNSTYVGKPVVTNAAVHAVVEEKLLDDKVIVFKYKKKKNYRRNIGHRQPITRIRITGITGYEDYPAATLDLQTISS